MNIALTDIETVRKMLRIDSDDANLELEILILAASARIVLHLGDRADELLDLNTTGEMDSAFEVPPLIELATVGLVGYLYRNPDADPDKDFGVGTLPNSVKTLLYPLRDPVIA